MLGGNATFDDLMWDTHEGWGFWPVPDGQSAIAKGATMKQMRSWAQMVDNRGW